MGCTPSSCTSFPAVGTMMRLKSEKVTPRTARENRHSSRLTVTSSKPRSKSGKENKQRAPKSNSVFYDDYDIGNQDNSKMLMTSQWNDHRDLELDIPDCDADSDVTLQDTESDAESDTTLEGDYGEDGDQLITGTGKSCSKWTVTVQITANHRPSQGAVVPSVEECNQRESFGRGKSKKKSSLKRRTQKSLQSAETDTGFQNPAYAWVGDSATAYKRGQGKDQSQSKSHGQIKVNNSNQDNNSRDKSQRKKVLKSRENVKHSKPERELKKLRTNFIPVKSKGDEEEDTWHSLCDSTTALDAQSRCDSRADDFDDNLSMATSLDADSIITDYLGSDIIEDFSGSTHSLNTLSSAKALQTSENHATASGESHTGASGESRTSPESGFVNGTSTSSVLLGPRSVHERALRPDSAMTAMTTNTTNPRHRPKAAGRQRSIKN